MLELARGGDEKMLKNYLVLMISFLVLMTGTLPMQVSARCIVGSNQPCEFPAMPVFVNSFGDEYTEIVAGKEVYVQFDIPNRKNVEQPFVYLVLVQNRNEFTEQLSWTSGKLEENKVTRASIAWTPENAGDYVISVLVWSDLEKPTILEPMRTITVTVFPVCD
jgi:hypothetical protein